MALALILFLIGITRSVARAQPPAEVRLRSGDQLDVQIKNEPELSGLYPVTTEGAAMLPLVGRVDVAGRPFADVETAIRALYAKELADPDVLITPLQRVSVLGEVRLPGFQWVDPMATPRDAIVLSGGLTPSANHDRIVLLRAESEVRLSMADDGAMTPVLLRSGDQLTIGRRSWVRENLGILIGAAASVAAAAVTSWIIR
ncbi:MAG: polysaccharide biosynthesis/export family protein [Longimicrobiales bacterium]